MAKFSRTFQASRTARALFAGTLSVCALIASTHLHAASERIVGGISIDISEAPSTVALLDSGIFQSTGGNARIAQFCGGTVIAERFVLTAAHCVVRQDANGATIFTQASEILVLAGSTDLTQPVTQPVAVTNVTPHPQYVDVQFGSDLALLELAASTGAPIMPLDDEDIVLDQFAATVGWGALNEGSDTEQQSFPNGLQGVLVRLVPPEQCDQLFPQQMQVTGVGITPDQVCAAVGGGGSDSCQGDSGGPLYRVNDNSEPISLVGVVSYGIGCARAEFPGVYAGVRTQRDFFTSVLNAEPTTTPTTNPDEPDQPDIEGPVTNFIPDADDDGSGCTIGGGNSRDPLLPGMVLLSLLFVLRRKWQFSS